jgi:hypothetical protein
MKKLKKFIALFTAALFCILPLLSQPLTAQASTPTTYYLKYVDNQWRYLTNVTSWDETGFHRELYYMHQDIKDGDIIIVDGNERLELSVNATLSNITILHTPLAVVTAKGYDEVHVASNSSAAINGNVKSAIVYDGCAVNFNNDIQNLRVEGTSSVNILGNAKDLVVYASYDPTANIVCEGVVDHVKTYDDYRTYYEFYSFAKGSLNIMNGSLMTDASNYSKTAPAATTTPSTSTSKPAAGELDDVPKTGDFSVSPVWFLGLAVVCMLGYRKLERR